MTSASVTSTSKWYAPPLTRPAWLHWLVLAGITASLVSLSISAGYISVMGIAGWKLEKARHLYIAAFLFLSWSIVGVNAYAFVRWLGKPWALWLAPLIIATSIVLWLLA